jgi:hypothetical protein
MIRRSLFLLDRLLQEKLRRYTAFSMEYQSPVDKGFDTNLRISCDMTLLG